MAVEAKRGCGYRKVGGKYLISGGVGMTCGRLPFPLLPCRCCGRGIKQARGWTWVDGEELINSGAPDCTMTETHCAFCPMMDLKRFKKAGLLWVGERFYKTPDAFQLEASALGISRRIHSVPRDFKLGETWVMLAHPKAARIDVENDEFEGGLERVECPGVFRIFKPERIEIIVTESDFADDKKMERLIKQGLTPVPVPDDDPDHMAK